MTDTLPTQQPMKPPVDAELAGPISGQPIGAVSQQMTASGEQGSAQPAEQPSGLGITPAQTATAPYTGGSVTSAAGSASSGAVSSALAQQIATAISIGLAQAPTTAAGWAQLADYYSTSAGQNEITTAEQSGGPTSALASAPGTATSPSTTVQPAGGSTSGALGTNAFLAAIRQHESGGNYKAYNAGGGASGAYQFIQSTWTSEATAAGYSQYAGGPASDAPPAVQDAVAAHMANTYYSEYGNWQDAAEAWYEPADVGKNVVPDPQAGNTETVTQYGQQIMALMGQQPQLDSASSVAGASNNIVKIAQSQIGTPYVWGGEDPNSPGHPGEFDCSGLVQWVYGQAGTTLPRVAQAQYNATPKVAANTPLQPGDLLFFGSGPNGIEHVGIYIGNNQMIDAPHTGADVRIDQDPTSWANYVGATRPGDPSGATTASTGPAAATASQANDQYGQILQQVTQQLTQLGSQYPGMFNQTEAVLP
jgi:cell wall-associated NlpC family hydrolase